MNLCNRKCTAGSNEGQFKDFSERFKARLLCRSAFRQPCLGAREKALKRRELDLTGLVAFQSSLMT